MMRFLSGLFLLLTQTTLFADLTFEKELVAVKAAPTDEQAVAEFPFKNTGTTTVEILDIESHCGCLAAGADKTTYAPGESGVMKAVYSVGNLSGHNEKSIFLHLKGNSKEEVQLTMSVDIPIFFTIEPKVVQWKVGDKVEPKSLTLKVVDGEPVDVTSVSSTRESFTFRTEVVKPGREFKIILTPSSTAEPIMGALKIETTSKIPRYHQQLAFYAVRKPYLDKDGKEIKFEDN